jgi:hypothetical protein
MNTRGHAARRPARPAAAVIPMLLCLHVGAAAAQVDYLSIAPDLPLMPGLSEHAERASNFDSPSGRIAETWASGAATAPQVQRFYGDSLPALGWVRCAGIAGCWQREDEELRIATEPGEGADLWVLFRLKPEPN